MIKLIVRYWTSFKSKGGLKMPLVTVRKLEIEFQKLHLDSISKNKNILKNLTN